MKYVIESDSVSDESLDGTVGGEVFRAFTENIEGATLEPAIKQMSLIEEPLVKEPLQEEVLQEEPPKQSVKAILAKEGTFYSKYLQGSDFIELQVLNFYEQKETRIEFSKIFYGVIDLLGF